MRFTINMLTTIKFEALSSCVHLWGSNRWFWLSNRLLGDDVQTSIPASSSGDLYWWQIWNLPNSLGIIVLEAVSCYSDKPREYFCKVNSLMGSLSIVMSYQQGNIFSGPSVATLGVIFFVILFGEPLRPWRVFVALVAEHPNLSLLCHNDPSSHDDWTTKGQTNIFSPRVLEQEIVKSLRSVIWKEVTGDWAGNGGASYLNILVHPVQFVSLLLWLLLLPEWTMVENKGCILDWRSVSVDSCVDMILLIDI